MRAVSTSLEAAISFSVVWFSASWAFKLATLASSSLASASKLASLAFRSACLATTVACKSSNLSFSACKLSIFSFSMDCNWVMAMARLIKSVTLSALNKALQLYSKLPLTWMFFNRSATTAWRFSMVAWVVSISASAF